MWWFWLSKYKSKNHELCKNNISQCKVILTKEAIDTGVDIPAIQVIVQLRSVSSVQVEVQKLGRGFRMPKQHHYQNALDKLYFYVFNDHVLDWTGAEYLQAVLERRYSLIRPEFIKEMTTFPTLQSSWFTRKSPLREASEAEFNEVFVPIFQAKLKSFGAFNFNKTYTEETLEGSLNLDTKSFKNDTFGQSLLEEDSVNNVYVSRMRTNLKHMFKHLNAIADCVGNYLQEKDQYESDTQQQIFALNNISELMRMVFEALDEAEEIEGKHKVSMVEDYNLPPDMFIEGEADTNFKKHLHDKYFITRGGRSNVEREFETMLEIHPKVKWWMKNYDRQYGKSYSVQYKGAVDETDNVFFPDYIIALTNNTYLIVDTKDGNLDVNEGKKREALLEALKKYPNVLGGIVKQEREHFYIHGKEDRVRLLNEVIGGTIITMNTNNTHLLIPRPLLIRLIATIASCDMSSQDRKLICQLLHMTEAEIQREYYNQQTSNGWIHDNTP